MFDALLHENQSLGAEGAVRIIPTLENRTKTRQRQRGRKRGAIRSERWMERERVRETKLGGSGKETGQDPNLPRSGQGLGRKFN